MVDHPVPIVSEANIIAQNWREAQLQRQAIKAGRKLKKRGEADVSTADKPQLPGPQRKQSLCRHHLSRIKGTIGRRV